MIFFIEIFGHDGTITYMNHNLDLKGQTIANANQLSAITCVYTPTWGALNIEFSDVGNSGATDLKTKSGSTNFMTFNVSNGINFCKPLSMNNSS